MAALPRSLVAMSGSGNGCVVRHFAVARFCPLLEQPGLLASAKHLQGFELLAERMRSIDFNLGNVCQDVPRQDILKLRQLIEQRKEHYRTGCSFGIFS